MEPLISSVRLIWTVLVILLIVALVVYLARRG